MPEFNFHHMMIVVSDMDEAIRLWRDVLGFTLNADATLPDGPEPSPTCVMYPALLDDIFKAAGATSRCALLTSPGGALIELQQPSVPLVQKSPSENLQYGFTGISELALQVTDIESWFKRIRDAGFRTQTEYVWDCGSIGRSFLFYDQDGSMIQLWEHPGKPSWGM